MAIPQSKPRPFLLRGYSLIAGLGKILNTQKVGLVPRYGRGDGAIPIGANEPCKVFLENFVLTPIHHKDSVAQHQSVPSTPGRPFLGASDDGMARTRPLPNIVHLPDAENPLVQFDTKYLGLPFKIFGVRRGFFRGEGLSL